MNLIDVKKALISLLQKDFSKNQYTYYAKEVVEGYKRPSFFTQIKPVEMSPVNYNSRQNTMLFYVTYMQKEFDEAEALETISKIRERFGLYVKVQDRAIKVTEFSYDFVGESYNIPQISIQLEWMDKIEHTGSNEKMETMKLNNNWR